MCVWLSTHSTLDGYKFTSFVYTVLFINTQLHMRCSCLDFGDTISLLQCYRGIHWISIHKRNVIIYGGGR